MAIRSFLAFELPSDIKDAVVRVSEELRQSPLDARWAKVANIHLTMVFMGNIHEDTIQPIQEEAQKVCQDYGRFEISVQGIGSFPNNRNPRVIWVGVSGDLVRLSSFRDELVKSLIPFGVGEEKRSFKPHLTLGRFRKPGKRVSQLNEFMTKYGALTSPVCLLEELVLFRSDLNPSGAVYTKLGAWPLSGRK